MENNKQELEIGGHKNGLATYSEELIEFREDKMMAQTYIATDCTNDNLLRLLKF